MTFRRDLRCGYLLLVVSCAGASSDHHSSGKNAESVGQGLASLAASYYACNAKGLAEQFTPKG